MYLLSTTISSEEAAETAENIVNSVRGITVGKVIATIVLVAVLIVLVQLFSRLFAKMLEKSKLDKTAHGFLKTLVKIVLYFIAALIVAGSLNIDVTSLIAVLSVAGLAVSLALQGVLGNVASGLVILTTKPVHVGDYVKIGSNEGYVQEINMTYTILNTNDRRVVYIPNSTVTSSDVLNYTVDGKRRVDLIFTASYDDDVEAVKSALASAVNSVPAFFRNPPPFIHVNAYGDSSIEYIVRAYCKGEDYWEAYYSLLEAVKRAYDAAGIHMSYPHMNVHVDMPSTAQAGPVAPPVPPAAIPAPQADESASQQID